MDDRIVVTHTHTHTHLCSVSVLHEGVGAVQLEHEDTAVVICGQWGVTRFVSRAIFFVLLLLMLVVRIRKAFGHIPACFAVSSLP